MGVVGRQGQMVDWEDVYVGAVLPTLLQVLHDLCTAVAILPAAMLVSCASESMTWRGTCHWLMMRSPMAMCIPDVHPWGLKDAGDLLSSAAPCMAGLNAEAVPHSTRYCYTQGKQGGGPLMAVA